MSQRIEPWNVKQLWEEMTDKLMECKTPSERAAVSNSCLQNIKAKAEEWRAKRRLTPGEEAVLANCIS